MADLFYVALIFALTGLGALFVIGCDRLIGPDESDHAEEAPRATTTQHSWQKLAP